MLKQLKSLDNSEDEAGAFANAIACKLRRMTPYQMSMAQRRILQVTSDIEFGCPPTTPAIPHSSTPLTHQPPASPFFPPPTHTSHQLPAPSSDYHQPPAQSYHQLSAQSSYPSTTAHQPPAPSHQSSAPSSCTASQHTHSKVLARATYSPIASPSTSQTQSPVLSEDNLSNTYLGSLL